MNDYTLSTFVSVKISNITPDLRDRAAVFDEIKENLKQFSDYGIGVSRLQNNRIAYINFKRHEDADKCLDDLQSLHIGGFPVNVEPQLHGGFDETRKMSGVGRGGYRGRLSSFRGASARGRSALTRFGSSRTSFLPKSRPKMSRTISGVPRKGAVKLRSSVKRPSYLLYVSKLDPDTNNDELWRIFKPYGFILDIDIKQKWAGGPTFAFVHYFNVDMAVRAKRELAGKYITRRRLFLSYSTPMPNTAVWIGGIESGTDEEKLKNLCADYGQIKRFHWPHGKNYAYVVFSEIEAATLAVENMHGISFGRDGKRLFLEFTKGDRIDSELNFREFDFEGMEHDDDNEKFAYMQHVKADENGPSGDENSELGDKPKNHLLDSLKRARDDDKPEADSSQNWRKNENDDKVGSGEGRAKRQRTTFDSYNPRPTSRDHSEIRSRLGKTPPGSPAYIASKSVNVHHQSPDRHVSTTSLYDEQDELSKCKWNEDWENKDYKYDDEYDGERFGQRARDTYDDDLEGQERYDAERIINIKRGQLSQRARVRQRGGFPRRGRIFTSSKECDSLHDQRPSGDNRRSQRNAYRDDRTYEGEQSKDTLRPWDDDWSQYDHHKRRDPGSSDRSCIYLSERRKTYEHESDRFDRDGKGLQCDARERMERGRGSQRRSGRGRFDHRERASFRTRGSRYTRRSRSRSFEDRNLKHDRYDRGDGYDTKRGDLERRRRRSRSRSFERRRYDSRDRQPSSLERSRGRRSCSYDFDPDTARRFGQEETSKDSASNAMAQNVPDSYGHQIRSPEPVQNGSPEARERQNASPSLHGQNGRNPGVYSERGPELYRTENPSDRQSKSPGPFRSSSPGVYNRQSRSPEPRLLRSISPEPYHRRSRSPGPHHRRSRSPEPYSKQSRSPEPYRKLSRSPEPYRKYSRSPEPYHKQSRSPNPCRSAEQDWHNTHSTSTNSRNFSDEKMHELVNKAKECSNKYNSSVEHLSRVNLYSGHASLDNVAHGTGANDSNRVMETMHEVRYVPVPVPVPHFAYMHPPNPLLFPPPPLMHHTLPPMRHPIAASLPIAPGVGASLPSVAPSGAKPPEFVDPKTSILSRYPVVWSGALVLKSSAFVVNMYMLNGSVALVDDLLRDPWKPDCPALKISQRLRLDLQQKLDEVERRFTSCGRNGYSIMLAAPATAQIGDVNNVIQQRPLHSLGSYLQEKDCAAVVFLPPGCKLELGEERGVLYAFPPCKFAKEFLHREAPEMSGSFPATDHLLCIVMREKSVA